MLASLLRDALGDNSVRLLSQFPHDVFEFVSPTSHWPLQAVAEIWRVEYEDVDATLRRLSPLETGMVAQ